jgi:hypothetical protein
MFEVTVTDKNSIHGGLVEAKIELRAFSKTEACALFHLAIAHAFPDEIGE